MNYTSSRNPGFLLKGEPTVHYRTINYACLEVHAPCEIYSIIAHLAEGFYDALDISFHIRWLIGLIERGIVEKRNEGKE